MRSQALFYNYEKEKKITSSFVNHIRSISVNKMVLYLSCVNSKEYLLRKYKVLNRANITIINDTSLLLDDIEKYILQYKPKYVFVDYFIMVDSYNFRIQGKKLYYIRNMLESLESKYNVVVLMALNKKWRKRKKWSYSIFFTPIFRFFCTFFTTIFLFCISFKLFVTYRTSF